MADHVYLNADRTAVVDRLTSTAKLWKVSVKEAIALGLLPADHKPQERRVQSAESAWDGSVSPTRPKRRYTKRKP